MTRSGVPINAHSPSDRHLESTEARLARLSVLQELTVTALDLFNPDSPADPFLERVAERLGCLAALWLTFESDHPVTLFGAAGLSAASRALPITPLAAGRRDPATMSFPYPELARGATTRWHFCLQESAKVPAGPSHALLLWFDHAQEPPAEYLGAVERLVGVLRTVLTHRRLAEDLRRSYAELARTQQALVERERLAATGELAAVVAHEVRNPLAVIFNCVGTLQKASTTPGEASGLLLILAEEAMRLNYIVSELLDFARPSELVLFPESLEDILTGAIAAVQAAQTQATAVQIELEIVHSVPPVRLDARLVRRAAINLVSNAVQSMPGGGHVVVRIDQDTLNQRVCISS